LPARRVKEGLVELELKEDARLDLARGPQTAGASMVFYNPAAKTSRDLTVVVLRALPVPKGGWRALDGLCGSGVRGLRVALEVERVTELTLNDGDPEAAALAASQAERNGVRFARVTNRSLEEALADSTSRYDFIDIDPYGSPVRHLTAAAGRASRPGYVAATATDVAALCGVFPSACVRRYGAAPLRNEWMKETACRILLGAAARKAGAVDRAIEPVATLCTDHYIRILYRVAKGRQAADRAAAQVGFLKLDAQGRESPQTVPLASLPRDEPVLARPGALAGPMWLGPLHEQETLARATLPPWILDNAPLARFLEVAPAEANMPPYHFMLDEAARKLRRSPPPTQTAIDALLSLGFKATRTHFNRKAVKTTASPAELLEALAPLTR
jgi:tRNA (guanine26-N2/guanine27-N2)-dimethyltransferase